METPANMVTEQQTKDLAAIRQAALDYIEGWYTGNVERMERALHPDLVKRCIMPDPRGFDRLDPISAMGMVLATRHGAGRGTPLDRADIAVTIYDVYGNTASARVESLHFVDYLHIGRMDGDWQIVNVLWERRKNNA